MVPTIKYIKDNQKTIIFAILFFILLFGFCVYMIQQEKEDKRRYAAELQRFEEKAWNDYNTGLGFLQKKYVGYNDSEKAADALFTLTGYKEHLVEQNKLDKVKILNDPKYKDAETLYYYAKAIVNYNDLKLDKQIACDFALRELDKIPAGYNGVLTDDINNYRNYVSTKKKENQMLRDALNEADKHEQATKVHIGDPDIKVTQIFGEPKQKNKTVTQNGTREQWVYGNGTYIYLQNGTVTSWQMRE